MELSEQQIDVDTLVDAMTRDKLRCIRIPYTNWDAGSLHRSLKIIIELSRSGSSDWQRNLPRIRHVVNASSLEIYIVIRQADYDCILNPPMNTYGMTVLNFFKEFTSWLNMCRITDRDIGSYTYFQYGEITAREFISYMVLHGLSLEDMAYVVNWPRPLPG